MITSTKLYVPVVTLSINDNIKFLKNIKQELKKTQIYPWNNKISKKNSLDYLSDPTLRTINRFVLLFKNGDNDPTRDCFEKYYMPLVEVKDFPW